MNKKFVLLFLMGCGVINRPIKSMAEIDSAQMAWSGGSLVLTAITVYALKSFGDSYYAESFANITGYNVVDIQGVVGITGGLYSLGCLSNNPAMFKYAIRTPLAAIIGGFSTTKMFSNIAQNLPLVGSYFSCSNPDCNGVCSQCRLRGILKSIGSYALAIYSIDALMRR